MVKINILPTLDQYVRIELTTVTWKDTVLPLLESPLTSLLIFAFPLATYRGPPIGSVAPVVV